MSSSVITTNTNYVNGIVNRAVVLQFNKYFHIYSGRFAYLAGVVQCYRGLELVAGEDQLLFSAGDTEFEVMNIG